jgi:hypothetical protein
VVISDQGAVYRNDRAWIMCLFALEAYREWANRLAHPLLRPLARQAFTLLSKERSRVSRWLSLASEVEIAETLGHVSAPACPVHAADGFAGATKSAQVTERAPIGEVPPSPAVWDEDHEIAST